MNLPSRDQHRTDVAPAPARPRGLDAVAHRLQGRWRGRGTHAEGLSVIAERVYATAETFRGLGNHELQVQLDAAADRIRRRGTRWEAEFPAVLPLLVEAADRRLGMRPYAVQVMGALGLGHGRLVEMATGEGKTLTIALAAVASGWLRRPCHVITANDYLAERDAGNMARLYDFCRLRVGFITATMSAEDRARQYACDVVYTTSKELVADFLRDRMILGPLHSAPRRTVRSLLKATAPRLALVMRGLHTAIIDEADNLMVDEAVTPLIISRRQDNSDLREACQLAAEVAAGLVRGTDYSVDEENKDIRLLDPGLRKLHEIAPTRGSVYQGATWLRELLEQALRARHFYVRGKHYVIQDGVVVIVDEFTGRMMPGRTWRLGLHQAVEAKEGLEITPPSEALARLSFQRFFRLFRRLSGITGTAREAADEFWSVYELPFTAVPPNRPCQRVNWPTRFFRTAAEKWEAVVEEIQTVHATGRPVLVGTRSVAASEALAERLHARHLAFSVLNAVRHREEAGIILHAGEKHVLTIATNMAGRGTDIRIDADVAKLGGLHVFLTEPHEAGRIDRQLQGRAGRQGDAGSTRTFVSLEDEVLVRFLPRYQQRLMRLLFSAPPAIARPLLGAALRRAQRNAQRRAFLQRRLVTQQDSSLAEALTMGYVDQI